MSRRRSPWSGRSARTSGSAAPRRSASTPPASTAWTWPLPGCPSRPWTRRWPRLTRTSGPRWRRRYAGPGGCTAPSSRRIVTPVIDGLTVTGRFVPVSRAGVYVPGGLVAYPSSVVMNIVPAQAAGVARDRGGVPAAGATTTGCRTRRAGRLRAARRDRGARGRRRAGAGDVRLRHRGLRAADVITGPGNVYVAAANGCCAAWSAPTARPARPRWGSSPMSPRTPLRRGRPGRPGRARRAGRLPAHHHGRRAGRRGRR